MPTAFSAYVLALRMGTALKVAGLVSLSTSIVMFTLQATLALLQALG